MDRKFDGLIKVLNEMTSEHKYLEIGDVQGSSEKIRTSFECYKDSKLQIRYIYQVTGAGFSEGKKARTWVQYPKNKNLQLASTHQVNNAYFCEDNQTIWRK